MRMRMALFIAAVLMLAAHSCALSIYAGQVPYVKGDIIDMRGDCAVETVELNAEVQGKFIFHETVACTDENTYSYSHKIRQIDPTGTWILKASAATSRHETQIKVQPTRESSYLVLTLLRPSEKKQNRASEMPITIKVTDGGNPLTDANVMMWGPDGSRHELKVQQDGLYSLQYFIPIDASLGLWAVTVTAERNSGGTTIGGERVFNMSVGYAPVEIIFESPEASNFELGFEIPVTAKIRYPDGRPFTESVVLNVRGAEFPMERGANNTYNYRYMPLENSIGAVELIVEAKDKYGNSGSASKTVTINEGMFSIENIMLAGAGTALAAVILVYLFLRSRFGVLKRKKHAKGVKENVEAQILSLKKDYYEKASISKGTFRKRMSELEAELEAAGNGGKK